MTGRPLGIVTIVLGMLMLTGCAGRSAGPGANPSPSQSPYCACYGTEKVDVPGCVMYEAQDPTQVNNAYKIRMTAAAKDQPSLDKALLKAKASLDAILAPPATADLVKTTLKADGFIFVEVASDARTGTVFWAEVGDHGCLFGGIDSENVLKIEAGGFMPDGGCRLITGH